MSLDKPSKPEDEYFAAEEVEAKRRLAFQQGKLLAQQQREALKAQAAHGPHRTPLVDAILNLFKRD